MLLRRGVVFTLFFILIYCLSHIPSFSLWVSYSPLLSTKWSLVGKWKIWILDVFVRKIRRSQRVELQEFCPFYGFCMWSAPANPNSYNVQFVSFRFEYCYKHNHFTTIALKNKIINCNDSRDIIKFET